MKNLFKVLFAISLLVANTTVLANTSELSTCLIDNLNGKERKNLAVWVFMAMASHPEIKKYSNITPKDKTDTDKYIGALITRLLTEDCPKELKVAYSADPQAIQKAFEVVGKVAMQELMANQAVNASLVNYVNFADQTKINTVLSTK